MALTATPIRLFQHAFTAAGTDDLVYTVTQPKVIIKEIDLYNTSNRDANISLAVVPSGETLGVQHYVFLNGKALQEETKLFTPLSIVCETGDKIYVTTSRTNTYIYVSGVEFTTIP